MKYKVISGNDVVFMSKKVEEAIDCLNIMVSKGDITLNDDLKIVIQKIVDNLIEVYCCIDYI